MSGIPQPPLFLGTCVWLQSPNILTEINSKKLIADCYAAIAPNDRLLRLYVAEINRLRQTGIFSDDDCQLLRTHEVAYDILQEKTLGDTDSFTKKTTEEIFEELKEQIRKKEEKKYKDEVLKHNQTKRELRNIKREKDDLVVNINDRAEQYSNNVAKFLFAASAIPLTIGLIIMVIPNTFAFLGIFKYPLVVVSFVATLASLLYGFNLKRQRSRFKEWLKSRYIKRIMKQFAP